jgi:hypothetical protein
MQPDAPACVSVRLQQIRVAGALAREHLRASHRRHYRNSIEAATISALLQKA